MPWPIAPEGVQTAYRMNLLTHKLFPRLLRMDRVTMVPVALRVC